MSAKLALFMSLVLAVGVRADVETTAIPVTSSSGGGGAASAVTPNSTTVTGCQNLVLYGDNSSVLNCEAAFGYVTSTNTLTADNVTAGTQLIVPAGAAGVTSSMLFANDTDTGIFSVAAGNISFSTNGQERFRMGTAGDLQLTSSVGIGAIAGGDVVYGKHATNVGKVSSSVAGTSIRHLMGGGAAVASAATLPAPTGSVFHVTGTTNITGGITATNLGTGVQITLIFDGVLTISTGGNLILVGGTFATTANDTLTLVFDGTSFFEIARTVL